MNAKQAAEEINAFFSFIVTKGMQQKSIAVDIDSESNLKERFSIKNGDVNITAVANAQVNGCVLMTYRPIIAHVKHPTNIVNT
ncbi:hypothetical protein AWI06_08915 [Enterobacter hormaechei subsp. xiangfangensis]|nr:hypothetical protein AWI06_08915 [Enterobacter hormaechei subsp. xiangfangensis]